MTNNEIFNEPDFKRCTDFHGHICPGLSIGYRAAKAGLELIKESPSKDEEIIAILETDSCAADAIQVLTGCTFGKGNFFHRDLGKNAYSFQSRNSGKGFRLVMNNSAFNLDGRHSELMQKKKEGSATEEEILEFQELHHARSRDILTMDLEDLFAIEETERPLPAMAIMMPSIPCKKCNEGVMSTKLIEHNGEKYCQDCYNTISA